MPAEDKPIEYRILYRPSAESDIRKINKKHKEQLPSIVKKIRNLKINPRSTNAEKLSNNDEYRIRDGDYRITYTIDDSKKIVVIGRVRNRNEVYKKRR
ncbi:MAG: type II toxin-antitoxin system RelE/ParE family toxin [Thermoguttaceae bacterium]|jgi:mRNA interferase RelE/StbE